jgi:DNA polymerase
LYIRYPNLRLENGKKVYDSRRGTVSIWGGAMVENIVQALARIIVGEQMVTINKTYPVVLTVHDAAVCLVAKDSISQALDEITRVMSTAPEWAQGLPVACEAKYGESYGVS